jgi:hypothetical protein
MWWYLVYHTTRLGRRRVDARYDPVPKYAKSPRHPLTAVAITSSFVGRPQSTQPPSLLAGRRMSQGMPTPTPRYCLAEAAICLPGQSGGTTVISSFRPPNRFTGLFNHRSEHPDRGTIGWYWNRRSCIGSFCILYEWLYDCNLQFFLFLKCVCRNE